MFPFHSWPPRKSELRKSALTSQRQHYSLRKFNENVPDLRRLWTTHTRPKKKIGRERERKKVGGAKGGFERRKTPSGHLCVYNNKGGTGGGFVKG